MVAVMRVQHPLEKEELFDGDIEAEDDDGRILGLDILRWYILVLFVMILFVRT